MAVQDLCAARGLPFVCVQPLVSHVAREQEDLTGDKTDLLTELQSIVAGQEAKRLRQQAIKLPGMS